MNDPDTKRLVYVGGAILIGLTVVNQIYEAGVNAGLRASGRGGYDGDGFFPFPLVIIGLVLFVFYRRRAKRNGANSLGPGNGRDHGHGHGHGPDFGFGFGGGRPPRLFEEWHRRAHEANPTIPTTPPASATSPESRTREGTPVGTTLV